jgi:hypothetical protein
MMFSALFDLFSLAIGVREGKNRFVVVTGRIGWRGSLGHTAFSCSAISRPYMMHVRKKPFSFYLFTTGGSSAGAGARTGTISS